jgi:ribosome-associated protein
MSQAERQKRGGSSIIIRDMRTHPDKTSSNDAESASAEAETEVSRSQRRREALDVLRLAQALAALSDAQLREIPLDDDLREEVRRTRATRQQIAHKRQAQFLAKQMRKLDADELEAIRAALEHDRDAARRDTAALHRVETWRERLIAEGDDALGELLAAHPDADRQHLRTLARQARVERERARPPHAGRELFRALRELLRD